MAFTFEPGERLGDGFHRIGAHQLRSAERALRDAPDPTDALHEVRKATKRVRALLRVVRPGIKARRYHELDRLVGDAAQALSAGRDAQALVGTFDALVEVRDFVGADDVRAELTRRADRAAAAMRADRSVAVDAADRLAEARGRLEGTRVRGDRSVLRAGLHDVYRQARQAHRRCHEGEDDERWHHWRKRTKRLWHVVQLVEPASPALLGPVTTQLHHLADALGDDHDLQVLAELVRGHAWAFGSEPVRLRLFAAVDDARHELQWRALAAGARLLVERPDAFAERMVRLVGVADGGDEPVVGGLADLSELTAELDESGG